MHGLKHRTQRLQKGYATIQAKARCGDYDARIKNNLLEARVVAFETSPRRVVSRHAYKNALYATRRLLSSSFVLRKEATKESHHASVNKTDALLLRARDHAMIKSYDVSVAQDVFVLLSQYLGLTAVPEEPVDCPYNFSFARHKSFIVDRVYDSTRKFSRRRSLQSGFTTKSTSLADMNCGTHSNPKFPRSCVSLSDLGCEHVEEVPIYAT